LYGISQGFLLDIAKQCPNLTSLNLSNSSFEADLNWKEILPKFQSLKNLILLSCYPDQSPISKEFEFIQTRFPW